MRCPHYFALILLNAISSAAMAAGMFSAVVSPPRIEIAGKPGDKIREVIEVSNADSQPGKYQIRTNDWDLDAAGGPIFHEEIQKDSCRPWVALERRSFTLNSNVNRKLRFEVTIPADAKVGECRFAIMIQQDDAELSRIMAGNLPIPLQGRLAVIVYVKIGDAAPKLRIDGTKSIMQNGNLIPSIIVANDGTAHDRMEGVVQAVDAKGQKIDFSIAQRPILAGEKRELPFAVYVNQEQGAKPPEKWVAPLTLKGVLEAESGAKIPIDATFR